MSTSASESHPSVNTKKDKIQQTLNSTQKNKIEAYPRTVRSTLINKNRAIKLKDTASVLHSKLNVNSDLKCVTCNGYLFFDNPDSCVLDFINNVNARIKSKSVKKPLKRKVWKPTGKVFTNIGYIWRPTGRTFTIVGNVCPLTRITTTAEVPLRKPIALEGDTPKTVVVQIVLWYLDSGCSKHMTEDRSQLTNFLDKFLGTVKFRNDHVEKIMGYGDYQIGNVKILRVCFVEGLGYTLFFVGQFCDSDLEVAFCQHTCFIRNLEGVDLLTRSRGNNLYTLSLRDMKASSPISRQGLVRGLPKLKFEKDHLCSACAIGKSKKKSHKPKSEDTNKKNSIFCTWIFVDQCVSISHETSVAPSPQQNNVVERRNRTLLEAARTILIYAKASLFLWAKAVANACFTQNRSIVHLRHGKTPYKLLHDKLPDLLFFHVFGALCYPTNDSENLGKLQPKVDIATTSEQSSSGPALHEMTPITISLGLMPITPTSTMFVPPLRSDMDILFQSLFDELLTPPPSVNHPAPEVISLIAEVVDSESTASTGLPYSTTVNQDAPSPSNSQTTPKTQSSIIPNDVKEDNHDLDVSHMNNNSFFGILILEVRSDQFSSTDIIQTIMHPDHQISKHNNRWIKDHPLENIIGELTIPVSTRLQLHEQALFYYYDAFLTSVEPKTYKDVLTQSCRIKAMQ
nr:hypothetical protein [Tanacetum cinerariifolium]